MKKGPGKTYFNQDKFKTGGNCDCVGANTTLKPHNLINKPKNINGCKLCNKPMTGPAKLNF